MTTLAPAASTPYSAAPAIPSRTHRAPDGPYLLMGLQIRPVLTAADTGGIYSLLEIAVAPGAAIPEHVHAWEDEAWYVLDGRIDVTLDARTRRLGPGEAVFGPRGVPHAFGNPGPEPARILLTCTPGGFEHFFAECHAIFARTDDMAEFLACTRRHGMTFA